MPAFTLDDLIDCYRQGIFPMSDSRDDPTLYLVDPEWRGVLPLERFHVPSRLARSVRQDHYQVRINTRFSEIVSLCAEAAQDRDDTWISEGIQALYEALFARGMAHSVECWQGDQLLGGLYGVSLGGAFFGESMVSRARDASKVALVHLVARLKVGGYRLLDTQFQTDHLRQFGTEEIPRAAYKARLKAALEVEGDFYRLAPATGGLGALQSITQTS
jgi:leucyl/phenylalanyl-tRNA--protein transferase